jgi:hypothetical protein
VETPITIDHIVYAVPDLVAGIEEIASRTGVRPQAGGSHPGAGTANALLSLGDSVYLEIIGPDPQQNVAPQWFGLDQLTTGRLAGWAARTPALEQRVAAAAARGYEAGPIRDGRRTRPDGTVLRWRLAFPAGGLPAGDGLVPFLIDWLDSPHPAERAPAGCHLKQLRGEHPRPAAVQSSLKALSVRLPIRRGPAPRLVATLDTPAGQVVLT